MNAVVTPVDEDTAGKVVDPVDVVPSPGEEVPESPDQRQHVAEDTVNPEAQAASSEDIEAQRRQRLHAFLEKLVPNKKIWPQLAELQPPRDIFDRKDLPFDERTLIVSDKATGRCFGLFDSIMLPYYGAMFSVAGSIFVAFAALIDKSNKDDDVQYPNLNIVAMVGPLILGAFIMLLLHEFPCRVFLYHRLWEQKVVVDFKPREWTHRVTMGKLGFLLLCAAFYAWYGYVEFHANRAFYFVITQTFGTIAWVIYSSLAVDKYLIPINRAIRHTRSNVAPQTGSVESEKQKAAAGDSPVQPCATSEPHAKTAVVQPVDILGTTVTQMHIMEEKALKYDIFALTHYKNELAQAKKQAENDTSQLGRINEELAWLKLLASWVGRLGHVKSTVTWKVSFLERELYTFGFVGDSELFDDDFWHTNGSFASSPNKSGYSAAAIGTSYLLAGLSMVGIELAVLLG